MNAVDATDRDTQNDTSVPASQLTIILDTHPAAWDLLSSDLSLSKLLANLLVFINAHLAINNANRIAVIASHVQRAQWLYPTPSLPSHTSFPSDPTYPSESNPNKYRPFAHIEQTLTTNLRTLLSSTTASDLSSTPSTLLSGALTMALAHISKTTLTAPTLASGPTYDSAAGSFSAPPDPSNPTSTSGSTQLGKSHHGLTSRLLILSVSGDLSPQYIPLMNAIFACQRMHVPIDILKLAGDTVFLQQAADATGGVYLSLAASDTPTLSTSTNTDTATAVTPAKSSAVKRNAKLAGVLQYLLQAFLPDPSARQHLYLPGQATGVDFRAACFCHRRIVDIGFVCSICLSIFCEPLLGGHDTGGGEADGAAAVAGNVCLTCGTELQLGRYGTKPVVVARRKKVKKKRVPGTFEGREGTPMSGPGTPGA